MIRQLPLVALLLAGGMSLFAQQPSASVVGRVTDATGAVIPGVAIKMINLDTNQVQAGSSNQVGDFTIPYLNPGRYTMEASTAGFRTYKHTEFTLVCGSGAAHRYPARNRLRGGQRHHHRCASGAEHRERGARRGDHQRRDRGNAARRPQLLRPGLSHRRRHPQGRRRRRRLCGQRRPRRQLRLRHRRRGEHAEAQHRRHD